MSFPEKAAPLLVLVTSIQIILSGGVISLTRIAGLSQIAWLVRSRWGFGAIASTANLNVITSPQDNFTDPIWAHTSASWSREPAPGVTLVAEWHETRNGKIVRARSAFDGRIFAAMFGEPGGAEVPRRVRDLADLREAGGLQARAFIHFSPERHLLARRLPLCLGPAFPWMA